jgi:hypothetical protein
MTPSKDEAEETAKAILTLECERRGAIPIWPIVAKNEVASLIRAYGRRCREDERRKLSDEIQGMLV